MVRISTLLLIVFNFFIPSYALDACVINSYPIPPAKYVQEKFEEIWEKEGNSLDCKKFDTKLLIGTPAVVKELKSRGNYKRVYTFVLFPEVLKLDKRKNFYGVRIFPLPEKTYGRFLKKFHLKRKKVAVPLSRKVLKIAKLYLPKSDFDILEFKKSPTEVFSKLSNYRYIYIFPDPNLLKPINLILLLDFANQKNIKTLSGVFDLKKFNLTYVDEIDLDRLVAELIFLSKGRGKRKLLPFPCKEGYETKY